MDKQNWLTMGAARTPAPAEIAERIHGPQRFLQASVWWWWGLGALVVFAIALWTHPRWKEVPLLFAVLGFYLALMAFYYAEKTSLTTQATEERLEEYGLSAVDIRDRFNDIFQDHLIAPLQQYTDCAARIFLLLSTPAYGYGVLGSAKFMEFVIALAGLNNKCSLEVILFSPEDHFLYWANVLLWSEVRARQGLSQTFAEDFAKGIDSCMQRLEAAPHALASLQLWVTRATTVRQFAFFPAGSVKNSEASGQALHAIGRVYVVLTDQFTLSQDQYLDMFKARSTRVISAQQSYYVGAQSHFERVKVCPYTGRTGEAAMVGAGGNLSRQMQNLHADYILGRTRQTVLDPGSFSSEIDVFLKQALSYSECNGVSENEILFSVIRRTLQYFRNICDYPLVQAKLSEAQASSLMRAVVVCRQLASEYKAKALTEAVEDLLAFLSGRFEKAYTEVMRPTNCATEVAASRKPEALLPEPVSRQDPVLAGACTIVSATVQSDATLTANDFGTKQKLIDCLYNVLACGFAQSEYATEVQVSVNASGGAAQR